MGKQITAGHVISVLIGIMIPLFIWGVSVETRFERVKKNTDEIQTLKSNYESLENSLHENHEEVIENLHAIELQLKDKKDR